MYGHSFICFHAQQLHSLMQHTAAELQATPEDTPGHPNVDNIKSFKGASRNAEGVWMSGGVIHLMP